MAEKKVIEKTTAKKRKRISPYDQPVTSLSKPNTEKDGPSLVVVESPSKAKTINKYLGKGYVVRASMGHVRDLPGNGLAVEIENDFKPTYELVVTRKKIVNELRKLAEKCEEVYL